MEKNKSIDGLVSRNSKKPMTSKKPASKKPAPKKPAKKIIKVEEFISETTINENFLEPVQAFDFKEGDKDLKASKKSQKKVDKKAAKKMKKEKKKAGKVRKTLSILALLIVLTLIGGVTWVILWGNDIIAKITGGQGNVFDLLTFTNEVYEPLKTDENGRTNILAFGTSGYNMEGDEGEGVHDGAALTDSIMFISLDQETGDVAMLSLPRDLKASPTCTATGKINEIYWCNNQSGDNEQAGAEALMTEVSTILDVEIHYFVHINWGSLIQIVDILDGITVTLDETVYGYYRNYEADVPHTIYGEEALILSRERYGTSNGDFSRSANQQKILIGLKDKILEKNLGIQDYLSLATTLGDNLRTNFSIEELKTLGHLASTLDFDSMRQISLLEPERLMTTGMINGISYVLPSAGVGNYGKIQNYIAKMISSDPRIYEDPSILVLNSTETSGLANAEKIALEQEGFINIKTDNAPEGEYNKYELYSLSDKHGTKDLLERYYNTSAKSIDQLPENLPEDYDFIIILGD